MNMFAGSCGETALQESVQQRLKQNFLEFDIAKSNNVHTDILQCVEKLLLETVLTRVYYNQSKAAAILGISRSTVRKKIKEYGILPELLLGSERVRSKEH